MTGSIKDYTPNFNFIIPEFNITGWHDYLEENFRSIDAMFYNLFGINNYKGQWKNSTVYNVNDVVFIGEDTSYSGRLVKVLVQHTTAGTGNFTEFFTTNPSYYELFADASTAQLYAQEAKDWAVKMDGPVEEDLYSSKFYANIVNSLSAEITTLYNIRSDIQNVSLIGTEVVTVSNIKNSVQSVANNATNINTVAGNSSNINTVAGNSANININATNINAINMNASNISAIQNAYSNAQSALDSKNKAQEWAVSENIVDNTDYSAKYYAELASRQANPLRIGQIIHSSLPLTDAGLHLLDGALINGSGIYSEFITFIAGLVNTYPSLFETEANWQTSVSTYGTCGRFVYDSVNNTVRLPKITGFIEGTTDTNALGDLTTAGCPNITGSADWWAQGASLTNSNYSGAFTLQKGSYNGCGQGGNTSVQINIDASLSNPIYGNSNTVQPQSIKVLYYVVISTSVKTDIEVDIDEIATDLNSKADLDLSNINASQSARQIIAEWSLPDFSSEIALVNSTGGFTYTTPSIGYLKINVTDGAGNAYAQLYKGNDSTGISLNSLLGNQYIARTGDTYSGSAPKICLIPVGKNETYYFVTGNITRISLSFVPMRGV